MSKKYLLPTTTLKQTPENQRVIEEWIKKHNSGRFVIGPYNSEGFNRQSKMQNGRQSHPVIVSVTKQKEKNENIRKSNLLASKRMNTKHKTIEPNEIPAKIARWSSPVVSIKIESVPKPEKTYAHSESELNTASKQNPKPNAAKKSAHSESESNTVTKQDLMSKAEKKYNHSGSESNTASKQVPKPIVQPSNNLKGQLSAPNNLNKISLPTFKVGTKIVKTHPINKKRTTNLQTKHKPDVYSSVKYSYKHLLTPKNWTVTEFENDSSERFIVFSKAHMVKKKEKLVTVMERSLIIDKGGTIHYSVYGMPVNVKGTILPDALDSIKKLLSILHIFDKMQVCKGLGNDLQIVKTDSFVQDVFEVWRHIDCQLVLIKADQCQICLDTRNNLLEKEMLVKSEEMLLQCVEIQIKEEQI